MLSDKTVEIYRAIRQMFGIFYSETLRDIVQNRNIDLDAKNNSDIRAALSYMRDVSENPQKYFSRLATEEDWLWRAEKAKRSLHNVDDPADRVYNNVSPCLLDKGVAIKYRDFCKLVMNWEYCRTENDYHIKRVSINQQDRIVEQSKLVSELIPNKRLNFDEQITAVYGGKRR